MATTYTFKCVYKRNGIAAAPTVAPTITIVSAGDVVLVNAAATTALANLVGGYVYSYPGADDLDLIGKFLTTDATIDEADLYAYTPAILTNTLDARVSSRSTLTQADILSDATPFPGAFIDAAISTAVCDGPGAAPYAIVINDPGGNPLDGVNVWISTDLAGANIIFNGFTDTFGTVTPMLDAGNYFAWKQLSGYTFTNPQAFSAP